MDNEKKNARALRFGGYSLLVTLIVVAVVIALNVFFAQLPSAFTKPSTSAYDLYEITEQTETIVKGVKQKVFVYQIAQSGSEDEVIAEFVRRYTALNGKITYKAIDPVVQPTFVSTYTDAELSENSLIVTNEKGDISKCIDYNDIYPVSFASSEEYYYYMMGMGGGTTSFALENGLTSAIDYVSASVHPTVYYTTGHGEETVSANYEKYLTDDNLMLTELSLLTATEIPSDASLVMIYAPSNDFQDSETALLRSFLEGGGKVMLISDVQAGKLEKLYGLMAEFGLSYHDGLIFEADRNHFIQSPYYLLPTMTSSPITTLMSSTNVYVILPLAHPIDLSEEIDAAEWTATKLFTTTVDSYNKPDALTNEGGTIEKAEGDEDGPFAVGIMLENSGTGASLTWFSTPTLLDDQFASYGNGEYAIATFNYLCGKESSVSIASKSLAVEQLVVPGGAQVIWFVLLVLIVPVGTVLAGLAYWLKRRKR